ncbi:hypothetical protein NIES3275_53730 [Microchaete diplosiphon NIES-3275]|nr:hypothetical protein NIES3275_53730 [Microchaete diplosiphon NIES-3275]
MTTYIVALVSIPEFAQPPLSLKFFGQYFLDSNYFFLNNVATVLTTPQCHQWLVANS